MLFDRRKAIDARPVFIQSLIAVLVLFAISTCYVQTTLIRRLSEVEDQLVHVSRSVHRYHAIHQDRRS